MNENRTLQTIESIATLGWESADNGRTDPSIYADTFELIVNLIQGIRKEEAV